MANPSAADSMSITAATIPARLDRLPWGVFHSLVVVALGITWILDGLEVTLAGAVAGALKQSPQLHFDNSNVGLASSAYLAGAVCGAVLFGWLTDRLGRRKLFFITLLVYIAATLATGFSWNLPSFILFRFLTGAGIGGEYTAINSTIQELIPARYRGWTDLVINGSFWVGAALGGAGSVFLLDPSWFAIDLGWRLCFLIGGVLGIVILVMRLWIPESPRWLITHGHEAAAEDVIAGIERRFPAHYLDGAEKLAALRLQPRAHTQMRHVFEVLFNRHRRRALVGLSLMTAQAFFYNAIFFTYALVLTDFYQIPAAEVGCYILPFAAGNFTGPVLIGRFFDSWGRRPMITLTYALSGILLLVSGYLFEQGLLTAVTQTLCWMIVFFFASAAASSAYLTVSETFPLEMRALAIAIFFAIGTGLGGVAAPSFFGKLIDTGSRKDVFIGYVVGAALMLGAAMIQLIWGVAAERKQLEHVARPLTAVDD
ncbi:MAG TPA: MFS transporter [Terriglobales bacterium]|nr:MFS transporter [Terriglobales bacterium]